MINNLREKCNAIYNKLALSSDQNFGFILSIMLLFLAGYLNGKGAVSLSLSLTFLGGIIALVAMIKPTRLHKFNCLWSLIGYLFGKVSQTIVLGVIFYLLFLPIGLTIKMCGKSELQLKPKNAQTFWSQRPQPQLLFDDTFKNQF